MLLPSGVEEAQFKRTESGWIFSAPNPWTFGWRQSYRVDDVQKAKLALGVRRGRYFRLLALILMYTLPLAAFWHYPYLLRAPSPWGWLLLALLYFVICTVSINLCDYLPIRHLLIDLPRSAERISIVEMHRTQAKSMSVKALATLTLIELLGCAVILGYWFLLPRHNPYMLAGAVCFGLIAMLFLAMLFTKLRAGRAV
jgi:hypothetical protein